jgi:DNA invertase Pin-like site-specific DNA recombinase
MVATLEKPRTRVPIVGKAAIYIRVSTEKQREEGASLEVQRDACRRYCEAHGWLVVAEFVDVQSGLDASRAQYQQAVELAKGKGVDKLVAWRLDRLGRDTAEYMPMLKGLKRLGVDVVSVTQPTESMFMQQVIGVMAEEESRQLSVRVTASKQRRFSEGKWGSAAPFGYTSQKDASSGSVLAPNAEAPLVAELFQKYAAGGCSLGDLQRMVKDAGYTKSRYAVDYILKNPVYLGIVQHGRFARSQFMPKPEVTQTKGQHPPLVDQATFDKVQVRLSENAHRNRGGVRPRYLFSGLIHCGICGNKYAGRTKKGHSDKTWVQYECNRRTAFQDCQSHTIFETRVRAEVLPPIEALLGNLRQEDVRKAVRAELTAAYEAALDADQKAQKGVAEQRERLEARLARLEDSYLDGDLSRERYLLRRDELMGHLQEVAAPGTSEPHLDLPDLERLFAIADTITVDTLDTGAWRDIIHDLVERITVTGHDVNVQWKPAYEPLSRFSGPAES